MCISRASWYSLCGSRLGAQGQGHCLGYHKGRHPEPLQSTYAARIVDPTAAAAAAGNAALRHTISVSVVTRRR